MSEVEHLDLEDLLELVRRLGVGPVRDVGLLDAAVARPRSSAFGADACPTLELKAAALLHSMVGNQVLVNGNKRLGWLATVVFLDLNGIEVMLTDDEAFDLVVSAAGGELDVEQIAERIARRPDPRWSSAGPVSASSEPARVWMRNGSCPTATPTAGEAGRRGGQRPAAGGARQ